MRIIVTIAALLSLAGCGGERTPDNDTIAVPENAAGTLPAPPVASGPAPSAVPSPTASSPGETDAGIPARAHGRWGLVPEDCTSTRGDNKGLLTITGDTLRFYESVGTLGEVTDRTPSRIVADFAMTGEGQQWTRQMVLDVHEGGKTLIRRELGDGAMPGALRYQRCA